MFEPTDASFSPEVPHHLKPRKKIQARREKQEKQYHSRKWSATFWCLIILASCLFAACLLTFLGKPVPDCFSNCLPLLCAVPTAYIGGNVAQDFIEKKK